MSACMCECETGGKKKRGRGREIKQPVSGPANQSVAASELTQGPSDLVKLQDETISKANSSTAVCGDSQLRHFHAVRW